MLLFHAQYNTDSSAGWSDLPGVHSKLTRKHEDPGNPINIRSVPRVNVEHPEATANRLPCTVHVCKALNRWQRAIFALFLTRTITGWETFHGVRRGFPAHATTCFPRNPEC